MRRSFRPQPHESFCEWLSRSWKIADVGWLSRNRSWIRHEGWLRLGLVVWLRGGWGHPCLGWEMAELASWLPNASECPSILRRDGEPTSRCLQRTHDGQAHGRTVAANGRWLASGCVAGERRLRRGVADPRVCVLFTTDTPICGIICGETKKKKGGRIWRIILFRAYC